MLLLLLLVHTLVLCAQKNIESAPVTEPSVVVPLGGNTWPSGEKGGSVDTTGIVNWTHAGVSFTTYVRLAKSGTIKLWLNLGVSTGKSILQVAVLNQEKKVAVNSIAGRTVYVGEWTIKDTGYIAIKIAGLSKNGSHFPNISAIKIGGTAIDETLLL